MSVEVQASVGLELATASDLAQHVKGIHGKLDSLKERQRPIYRNLFGATQIVAGTTFTDVLVTLTPAQGRLWNIVQIFGFGADGHTAPAGVTNCEVYAGDQSIASQGDQIDFFGNVPAVRTYSKGTIWCNSGSQVFMRVYGGNAGQVLQLQCKVLEYPDMAVESSGVPPIVG